MLSSRQILQSLQYVCAWVKRDIPPQHFFVSSSFKEEQFACHSKQSYDVFGAAVELCCIVEFLFFYFWANESHHLKHLYDCFGVFTFLSTTSNTTTNNNTFNLYSTFHIKVG